MKCSVTVNLVPHPNPDEVINMLARAIVNKFIDERKGKEQKQVINTIT